ncbi:type B 50S ribosomal protein L31 [Brachybacterium kimchii]|uniref:Large ribosomal subunit protein bL31B n=1 Tax=Brachybacterium kimchii TaxID=2942909 RepID=A0ABY4N416_9MICO|nr:type B 50S ribosomal protein L31 [Brachybacterium kimchii]UQN29309.1 type B 50S ribosomal protein L31 [Brachybacterium kimchii]
MKNGIHPDYHHVVFRDAGAGHSFLTRSTVTSDKTVLWDDGREYPVIDVEISSASHPFYTGSARVVDTAGRVEKFRRRYGTKSAGASTQEAAR